jgi:hypothetical protein
MKKTPKKVLRLPLEKRAEMAFKEAVEEVIDEHARLGLPLYIWRDGKVVDCPHKKCATILKRLRASESNDLSSSALPFDVSEHLERKGHLAF